MKFSPSPPSAPSPGAPQLSSSPAGPAASSREDSASQSVGRTEKRQTSSQGSEEVKDAVAPEGEAPAEQAEKEVILSEGDRSALMYALERRESIALNVLATLAVLTVLFATRDILVPMVFGCLIALMFRPVVRKLRRWGLPDLVGASLTLGVLMAILLLCVVNLIEPARHWIDTMPEQLQQLQAKLNGVFGQFKELAATADKVEELARGQQGASRPVRVEIAQSGLASNVAVLSVTGSAIGAGFLVVALAFFLLIWGDGLLNNVLHLLDTLSDKKRTVELVHDIERGIASYLLMVALINIGLGASIGISLWLLGVPNAGLWGVMTTVFNFVPFFGSLVAFVIVTIVSLLSFESFSYALIAPAVFLVLSGIESHFITPSVLGRSMSLNPILVFVALIFGGWMWGIGGAFLAVPLLAIAKLACERFERTRPFAVLMEA